MSVVKSHKPATGKKKKTFLDAFRRKGNQSTLKFVLLWVLKLALFGLFLMSVLFVLVYIGTFGELPDAETLIKIKEPVAKPKSFPRMAKCWEGTMWRTEAALLSKIYPRM